MTGSDCPGDLVWSDCGSACPQTCDNYDEMTTCIDMCVEGCFCPTDTVLRNGLDSTECVATDTCTDSTSGGELTDFVFKPF